MCKCLENPNQYMFLKSVNLNYMLFWNNGTNAWEMYALGMNETRNVSNLCQLNVFQWLINESMNLIFPSLFLVLP